MRISTLKTITSVVRSLKYDGTRLHLDNMANITKNNEDKYVLTCTNGIVLIQTILNDESLKDDILGNWIVNDLYKPIKKELLGFVNPTVFKYCLTKSERDYVNYQAVIPEEKKFTEITTISFNLQVMTQALKALKALEAKNYTMFFTSSLSLCKFSVNKYTFVLVMPIKL